MKKRIEFKDKLVMIIIFLIPILFSYIIFSKFQGGVSYIIAVIINSMYGAFLESMDLLRGEERTLKEKIKDLVFRLGTYTFIVIVLTILLCYNGIADLIITFLVTSIPYFINNMSIYYFVEKN